MGYFSASNTKVLQDGENSITIRKLTVMERQQADTSAAVFPAYSLVGKAMVPDGPITMDPTRRVASYLKCGIVKWEGPDFLDDDGQPVPCTDDNKLLLPSGLGQWVFEEIETFTSLSEHEKKA